MSRSCVTDSHLSNTLLTAIKKYWPRYASAYAALWAFGADTLDLQGTEPLYRIIVDLILNSDLQTCAVIADIGCGVGRVVRDVAQRLPTATVHGLDRSSAMLDVARRLLIEGQSLTVDLRPRGFGIVEVAACKLTNVKLWRVDESGEPARKHLQQRCNVVTSVNVIDRVRSPVAHMKLIGELLAPGGIAILATARNWIRANDWRRFNDPGDLLDNIYKHAHIRGCVRVVDLPYVEAIDINGASERYEVLVLFGKRSSAP